MYVMPRGHIRDNKNCWPMSKGDDENMTKGYDILLEFKFGFLEFIFIMSFKIGTIFATKSIKE